MSEKTEQTETVKLKEIVPFEIWQTIFENMMKKIDEEMSGEE